MEKTEDYAMRLYGKKGLCLIGWGAILIIALVFVDLLGLIVNYPKGSSSLIYLEIIALVCCGIFVGDWFFHWENRWHG